MIGIDWCLHQSCMEGPPSVHSMQTLLVVSDSDDRSRSRPTWFALNGFGTAGTRTSRWSGAREQGLARGGVVKRDESLEEA